MNLPNLDADYVIEHHAAVDLFKVVPGEYFTFETYYGKMYSFDVEYVDEAARAYTLEEEWDLIKVNENPRWTAYKVKERSRYETS